MTDRNWGDWLRLLAAAVAGLVLARLFPDFWDSVVTPVFIVVAIGLLVRHRRREDWREREEQAKRERERFQPWDEPGPEPTGGNGGLN